jgi:Fur family zinc uptake transcriptional regulator
MSSLKKLSPQRISLNEALALLAQSNYRLTRARRLLLETIFNQTKPFSVPALERLLNGEEGCDPVTIYRTLPVFEDLGIIEKCDFSEEMSFYETALAGSSQHHHHFVCKSCKKVEALELCLNEDQEQLLIKRGYTKLTHRLEFSGLCPECS